MELKRVTSALLGLPMVILVLLLGNKYVIDVTFSIVAIISLHEYYQAFDKYKPIKWVGYITAIFVCFMHLITGEQLLLFTLLTIPFIIAILFICIIIRNLEINIIDIAITILGIVYIVLFTAFLPLLAGTEYGKIFIWYPFFIAWGTDVFAYTFGKTLKLGKHKFTKVSPNKSIEGCIAGVIGATLLTFLLTLCIKQWIMAIPLSYTKAIIIAVVLSIIGQFGDLAASSIKRFTEIKDFSNLIPGHGGLLDRIDSLIFIAPFAYILLVLI